MMLIRNCSDTVGKIRKALKCSGLRELLTYAAETAVTAGMTTALRKPYPSDMHTVAFSMLMLKKAGNLAPIHNTF